MQNFPKYLTEREVSEFTRIGMKTLQQHRWKNKGIPFHKFGGSVRYSEEDVLQYMKNCRVETEVA
jgi:excisionase family DNA binding protein